jgi:hypothetical protein
MATYPRRSCCLLTLNEHGTCALGHGTGTYDGISGHGTYKLSILEIAARSKGNCSMSKKPVAFQTLISAQFPINLPSRLEPHPRDGEATAQGLRRPASRRPGSSSS